MPKTVTGNAVVGQNHWLFAGMMEIGMYHNPNIIAFILYTLSHASNTHSDESAYRSPTLLLP